MRKRINENFSYNIVFVADNAVKQRCGTKQSLCGLPTEQLV